MVSGDAEWPKVADAVIEADVNKVLTWFVMDLSRKKGVFSQGR
jgi:hypothetical protein